MQLDRIEAAIARFHRPENLKLLWLLEKETRQVAVVNGALELTLRRRIRDEEAIATRDAWAQEMGFGFEVIT